MKRCAVVSYGGLALCVISAGILLGRGLFELFRMAIRSGLMGWLFLVFVAGALLMLVGAVMDIGWRHFIRRVG